MLGDPPSNPDPPTSYPTSWPAAAIALEPAGSSAAIGGYHEIVLREMTSGKLSKRLPGIGQRTAAMAFHPHLPLLAVCSGTPGEMGAVYLLSLQQAGPPRLLARFVDIPPAAECSPAGDTLAVGATDGSIHLFAVDSGSRIATARIYADWVTDLAWSGDSQNLATASRDRTARVISTNLVLQATYSAHTAPLVQNCRVAKSGQAATLAVDGSLHLWRLSDGNPNARTILLAANAPASDIAMVENPPMLLVASGAGGILKYGIPKLEPAGRLDVPGKWVHSVGVAASNRIIAAGTQSGEIVIWNSDSDSDNSRGNFRAFAF